MCPFHEQNCFHIKHLHKISVCLGGPRHKNPIARENQDLKLSVCYRWFASRETKIGELETAHIHLSASFLGSAWGIEDESWVTKFSIGTISSWGKEIQPCISSAAHSKKLHSPSSDWHLPSRLASHDRKADHCGWICKVENQAQSSGLHTRWQDSSCLQEFLQSCRSLLGARPSGQVWYLPAGDWTAHECWPRTEDWLPSDPDTLGAEAVAATPSPRYPDWGRPGQDGNTLWGWRWSAGTCCP